MHICVYKCKVEDDVVLIESPRIEDQGAYAPSDGTWEVIDFKGVSEAFAEPSESSKPTIQIGVSPPQSPKATIANLTESTSNLSLAPLNSAPTYDLLTPPNSLLTYAYTILNTSHPPTKVSLTREAHAFLHASASNSVIDPIEAKKMSELTQAMGVPPREEGHEQVQPWEASKLKRGKGVSTKSRALMIHALANIEQWAVDLAWDIQVRYSDYKSPKGSRLPSDFFIDFSRMA